MADIRIAELTAEAGEVQGAIESARSIVDRLFENGEMFLRGARPLHWWSRCYAGDRTPTCRKRRLRLNGWPPCQPTPDLS